MSERKIYSGTKRHSLFDESSNPGETYNIDEILAPSELSLEERRKLDEKNALLDDSLSIEDFYAPLAAKRDNGESKFNPDNYNPYSDENQQVKYSGIISESPFEQSCLPGELLNYDDVLDLSEPKADSMVGDQFELPISTKELSENTKDNQEIYKFVITRHSFLTGSSRWTTKFFKLPNGMNKEDAYLVISAFINEYEKMYNLKHFDYKSVKNIVYILENYGFTIINDFDNFDNRNILDIVKGNLMYFIKSLNDINIEWYNPNANFQDIIRIYNKNNILIQERNFTDLDCIKKSYNPINSIKRNINKSKVKALIKHKVGLFE